MFRALGWPLLARPAPFMAALCGLLVGTVRALRGFADAELRRLRPVVVYCL